MPRALLIRFLPWLIALGSPAALGEPLGRLLLTPAERHSLDRQRQANPAYLPAGEGGERLLLIVGELHSSAGRHRRWRQGDADGMTSDAAASPRLPVGDRLHPATGWRERLLDDGSLRIRRSGGIDAAR